MIEELLIDPAYGDGIGRLTLNRPSVLNAIDERICDGLVAGMRRLEDAGCKVVLLDGAGRAFSAGVDIKYVRTLTGDDLPRYIEKTWVSFECLARSPLISIAVLHGYALGGGLELALGCDFRIIEADCRIGLPEMGLGTIPGSGAMQRLPPLVGRSATLDLAISGRRLSGEEAVGLGIANRLAETGDGLAAGGRWAIEIAKRTATSLRLAKQSLHHSQESAAAFHGIASAACHASGDYGDATNRFEGSVANSSP